MEEQIRRRRHLGDLALQIAKYDPPDLTDECCLQKKAQKKGEIVLFIKQLVGGKTTLLTAYPSHLNCEVLI